MKPILILQAKSSLRLARIALLCLTIVHLGSAKAEVSCRNLIKVPSGATGSLLINHLQLESTATHQNVERTLDEYIRNYGIGFARYIKAGSSVNGFHWIDVGGGAGLAPLGSLFYMKGILNSSNYTKPSLAEEMEARRQALGSIDKLDGVHKLTVITVENVMKKVARQEYGDLKTKILAESSLPESVRLTAGREIRDQQFTQQVWMTIHNKAIKDGRYRYLTGRFFEDYRSTELASADVITDNIGAFSYSPNKFEILRKYAELVKPGGVIFIRARLPDIVLKSGITMKFHEFLEVNPIPGLRTALDPSLLYIMPEPGTVTALKKLESMFELEIAIPDIPPQFTYRVRDDFAD